jgi:hypothetical protein
MVLSILGENIHENDPGVRFVFLTAAAGEKRSGPDLLPFMDCLRKRSPAFGRRLLII